MGIGVAIHFIKLLRGIRERLSDYGRLRLGTICLQHRVRIEHPSGTTSDKLLLSLPLDTAARYEADEAQNATLERLSFFPSAFSGFESLMDSSETFHALLKEQN